jgi:ATP-dependent DNA helicase RecG
MLKTNPGLTARELANVLGISQRAVEKQIYKLRQANRIRRIGPDKGGYWEVIA